MQVDLGIVSVSRHTGLHTRLDHLIPIYVTSLKPLGPCLDFWPSLRSKQMPDLVTGYSQNRKSSRFSSKQTGSSRRRKLPICPIPGLPKSHVRRPRGSARSSCIARRLTSIHCGTAGPQAPGSESGLADEAMSSIPAAGLNGCAIRKSDQCVLRN